MIPEPEDMPETQFKVNCNDLGPIVVRMTIGCGRDLSQNVDTEFWIDPSNREAATHKMDTIRAMLTEALAVQKSKAIDQWYQENLGPREIEEVDEEIEVDDDQEDDDE